MRELAGKNILITGASQGLGREMALRFAREGAAGLSLVARHIDQLNKVRDLVQNVTPKMDIVVIEADVSKARDIERIVASTLAQFKGHLDVLVNNASTIGPSPMPNLLDYPVEDFRNVLDTNLIGPFLLIKSALPAMIEGGGSIINVTSDAGQVGYPGWGAYGISKFGLEGMSQTWASELENTGVRVNWVDPGSMNTAMHRAAEPEEDPSEWADPADVTDVFVFLASDASKDVTGKRFQAQENWKAELSHDGHKGLKGQKD
ncbi:MAG TPA: SDR family oxidoreductase [Candidatus Udaeobacter sp.]|jgi:NAD(P)-dependent dehydrogenase (short-subunit alcohol dehydrogenase family)|nr:SDR family oxidoreductase [Candidatus Udaeobacter sp.]